MGDKNESNKEYIKGFFSGLAVSVIFIVMFLVGWNLKVNKLYSQYLKTDSTMSAPDITLDSKEFVKKVNKIYAYIDNLYLEEVSENTLVEGAMRGIVAALEDPYSSYYTAQEYKKLLESTSGEYEGIGVVVSQTEKGGEIVVKNVYANTPAEKAGLQKDDVILAIGGKSVVGEPSSTVAAYIKDGEIGTTVEIQVRRKEQILDLEVEREKIERETVSSEMMANQTGYIRLEEFDGVSTNQFSEALNELREQGMSRLIIDIRNNPGGRLDVVCDILDLFLEKEKLLVYTKDKNGKGEEEYTKYPASVTGIPIVIMVNENSASASEVFSGVMQDYGLAKIVGTKTFGKGIVQKIMDLGDGSAMKLTVSKYYLPNGENIHGEGITPDYIAEMPDDAAEDVQLDKAFEVLE